MSAQGVVRHAVKEVEARPVGHRTPDGRRCLCHAHCTACGRPVVVNRVGRYVHLVDYRRLEWRR